MKTLPFWFAITLLTALPTFGETPTADQLLAKARAKAAAEKKAIYLHFGASWCGWCKRLDAFLERDDIKPAFEKYFVPLKVVVQENDKNKSQENRGGDAVLQRLGGQGQGLPYSAFLDANGDLIVNSKGPAGNIGYPAQPAEIDWFLGMIKKAAPRMEETDIKVMETALRSYKPGT